MVILCFNPSVGILGVQATKKFHHMLEGGLFQSLGRDSGCSSLTVCGLKVGLALFQSLGRDSGCSSSWDVNGKATIPAVSIPRSGFWVFKLSHTEETAQ